MGIFTGKRRRPGTTTGSAVARPDDLDKLAAAITVSEARLLLTVQRMSSGRTVPGDDARLRMQREIIASHRARLERMTLPTGIGDDAEAWLRSVSPPA